MTINLGKRFFETFIYYLSSLFFTLFLFFSFSLVSGHMTKNQIIFEVLMLLIFSIINTALILTLYRENVTSLGFSRVLLFYILFLIVVAFGMKKISSSNISAVSFVPFVLIHYFYFVYNYKSVHLYQEFEEQCVGLSKKELKEKLYHNNVIALDYSANIKKTFFSQLCFAILCIILFIIQKNYLHYESNLLLAFVLIGYLICVFLNFLFFSTNKNEVFYAFLGFDKIFSFRNKIVKNSVIICAISVFFTLFLSFDKAIFNYKFLLALLKKIFVVESTVIQKSDIKNFSEPSMPSLILTDEVYKPYNNQIWNVLGYIIQIIFGILLVIFVLHFLLKPFFNEKFIDFFKNNKIKKYFMNFVQNLKKFFKSLFGSSLQLQNYTTVESKSFYDSINEFLKKSKKSKEKKEELDRFTKKFMKLVDWAKSKEIIYKKQYAPFEFCKMINLASAIKAGEIFEKALYSKELVSEQEEQEFINLIDEITK